MHHSKYKVAPDARGSTAAPGSEYVVLLEDTAAPPVGGISWGAATLACKLACLPLEHVRPDEHLVLGVAIWLRGEKLGEGLGAAAPASQADDHPPEQGLPSLPRLLDRREVPGEGRRGELRSQIGGEEPGVGAIGAALAALLLPQPAALLVLPRC